MRLFVRCALYGLLSFTLVRASVGADVMAQTMQMDDAARFAKLWVDQLEWRSGPQSESAWQGEGWYGGDANKAGLRSEGNALADRLEDARAELFWDRIVARWWSLQLGAREDYGVGPTRAWAAFGVRGLALQGISVEATLYAGAAARTAARLKLEYELLSTQRLVLQPEIELNLYGRAGPERDMDSGVSDLEVGLRLRYEVRREFAPYAGVVWVKRRTASAEVMSLSAAATDEVRIAVGVRIWL
ncbi:MAG TPA: copper resistance protein B [Steroidobacteraceae bacterium]